jgi:hypothetical protein
LNFESNNDAADFIFHSVGVNAVGTNGRKPNVQTYADLKRRAQSEEEHLDNKRNGVYDNGVGAISGLVHRGRNKGLYYAAADFDKIKAKEKFLGNRTLEDLAKEGFIIDDREQDEFSIHECQLHIGFYTKRQVPKLDSNEWGIEIISEGKVCTMPPTEYNKGNFRKYLLNTDNNFLTVAVQDEEIIKNRINEITEGHYLNGKADKNTPKTNINDDDEDDTIKWTKGERNDKLNRWAAKQYLKFGDNTHPDDIKTLVYAKDMRKCEPPLQTDYDEDGPYQMERLCKSAKEWADKNRTKNGKGEVETKQKLVIKKARSNVIKFFTDEYKEAHVAVKVNEHLEVLALHTSRFKDWLSRILYKEDNIVVDSNTYRDAIGVLNAEAVFDSGDPIKLNLRVAQRIEPIIAGDAIDASIRILWYYDLTNNNHEFIEMTSEGWSIVKNTELILFRRFNNQASQVYPLSPAEKGTDVFNEFIELLLDKNVKDENKKDYRHLLKVYIICLFIPEISKPVLLPRGSEGALKSTIFEKIKDIVDPSILKTLSFPRDKNEFIQQLGHNYVAYYDNISSLKYWISDEICRAVSGSGSSVRKLYTDDDDKIRSFKRCIGINGINLAATKPDLLDRGLQFELIRINKSDRLKEETINKKFQELRPYVLGYIFDTLVKVLRFKESEKIELKEFPRMADFAEYGEIISRCMGYPHNAFIDVYNRNTELRIDEVIESSEVARCLMYMMFEKYKDGFMKIDGSRTEDWIGTPSQLLGELNAIAISETSDLNIDVRDADWPKAAHILRRRTNEIMSTLKEKGIEIEYLTNQGAEKSRGIKIRKIASIASPASTDVKGA